MKRIKAACLEQTIHFALKDGESTQTARREVQLEYEKYKAQLDRSQTPYKIMEETTHPDGSILIKLKKQYNNYPVETYFE